jgi:hypothetical protein
MPPHYILIDIFQDIQQILHTMEVVSIYKIINEFHYYPHALLIFLLSLLDQGQFKLRFW